MLYTHGGHGLTLKRSGDANPSVDLRVLVRAATAARARLLRLRAGPPVTRLQPWASRIHLPALAPCGPQCHGLGEHHPGLLGEARRGDAAGGEYSVMTRRWLMRDTLQEKFRKRLGTALTWYQALDNRAETEVTQELRRESVHDGR